MATKILKTTFKLRRGLAAAFQKNNPVLADGEPAFELDTNKLKIGNGVDAYNDLEYICNGGSSGATLIWSDFDDEDSEIKDGETEQEVEE